jgi:alpha-L-fucosidase-like protein
MRRGLLFLFALALHAQDRAAWMRDAKFGVMTHYLADWIARGTHEPMSIDRWNSLVGGFDVERIAEQLKSAGAGYYVISIGQNSGYYLAPNTVYDKLTGISPSKLARRDLVADLYEAMHKRGIRLMVYLPSGAPSGDKAAVASLHWRNGPDRNKEFQQKWEQVIREWSLRWGKKVSGWWFDGCYWPNTMYRTEDGPNFATFAAAARAGNPDAALAFNPGVIHRLISITPYEDYIAGEIDDPDKIAIKRAADGKQDGAQLHVLTHLGAQWGMGAPRFTPAQAAEWSRKVVREGGAITWDTPVDATGLIAPEFAEQLKAIGNAVHDDVPRTRR